MCDSAIAQRAMELCHGAWGAIVGPHAAVGGLARRGWGRRIEGAALKCVLLSVLLSVVVVSAVFLRGMFVTTDAPANRRAPHGGEASAQ